MQIGAPGRSAPVQSGSRFRAGGLSSPDGRLRKFEFPNSRQGGYCHRGDRGFVGVNGCGAERLRWLWIVRSSCHDPARRVKGDATWHLLTQAAADIREFG